MRRVVAVLLTLTACSTSYPHETACIVGDQRDCTCSTGDPGLETCYDAVPSIWGACVCIRPPVAEAGSDRDVPAHTTVYLDGSRSTDPNGQQLHFMWTLDQLPAGSTATLSGVTAPAASFLADATGTYGVTLVVSDMVATSGPAHITITAR